MPRSALPLHLRDKLHWDYPWPFSKMPRAWTAFDWGVPVQVAGNQKEVRVDTMEMKIGPAPIGERGSWQLSRFPGALWPLRWIPLYFAFTLKSGWHFRVGARFDDTDSYVQFPTLALRRYGGGDAQDTSTK